MSTLLKMRESALTGIENQRFELVVIGGGIHGAMAAREAALRGVSTALVESGDFAQGTSSRSSKLLHGGIRYLESGNVALVFEALREREILARTAPHLSRVQKFLFPSISGMTKPSWQLGIGLHGYDVLARFAKVGSRDSIRFPSTRRIREGDPEHERLRDYGLKFNDLFEYGDAQVDDARLVIEAIVDAESLGCKAANYCSVTAINKEGSDWVLRMRSQFPEAECEVRAKALLNVTGGMVQSVRDMYAPWPQSWPILTFSRGAHLIFRKRWDLQGCTFPTGIPRRYYFILPLLSSSGEDLTLVGTTEGEVSRWELTPVPQQDEINELLGFLQRDIPGAKLDASSMLGSFCGIRTLYRSTASKHTRTSDLSRSQEVLRDEGAVTLVGGKYTTARSTALSLLEALLPKVEWRGSESSTSNRPFPGGASTEEEVISEGKKALDGTPASTAELGRAYRRFGSRLAKMLKNAQFPETGGEESQGINHLELLRRQLNLTIREEHPITVEDILRRRLGISFESSEARVEEVLNIVRQDFPALSGRTAKEVEAECEAWKSARSMGML